MVSKKKASSKSLPAGFKPVDVSMERFPKWDWDVSPTLQGTVVKVKAVPFHDKDEVYHRQCMTVEVDGDKHEVWETVALKEFMSNVGEGQQIWIHFTGIEKLTGGRKQRNFEAAVSD